MDNINGIHISYYGNHVLKYAYKPFNSTWSNDTADATALVGIWNSIAVDNLGYIHISYYDMNNYDLKYATNKSIVPELPVIIIPTVTIMAIFIILLRKEKTRDG